MFSTNLSQSSFDCFSVMIGVYLQPYNTKQRKPLPPGQLGSGTQGGMLRSESGNGQMPNAGWYCWKDDQTGLYYTYYEDDEKNNTMKTSYAEWAKDNVH